MILLGRSLRMAAHPAFRWDFLYHKQNMVVLMPAPYCSKGRGIARHHVARWPAASVAVGWTPGGQG